MRLLRTALFVLTLAPLAAGSVVNYNFAIVFTAGPLTGSTGSGALSFDTSMVQHQGPFNFVAPGGLGLLSLSFTAVSQTLNMTGAVNYPTMPTLYLDSSNAPTSLWGEWGSTTTTDAPAYSFGGVFGITYDTLADSLTSNRFSSGSSGGSFVEGIGDQESTGTLTFSPEPAAAIPVGIGLLLVYWMKRATVRR